MMIGLQIAQIAMSFDGQQEIQPNMGFRDPSYAAKIYATGWQKGEPWCAAAAIVDWTEAYAAVPELAGKARSLYSLNSQQMAENFHKDPVWPTSTTVPVVGSMAIFADGNSTTSGHTAVVIEVMPDGITYRTEEGNTIPANATGNQREGYIVAQHVHQVGRPHSVTGLNLLRFIHPLEA
ncbi:CHAP domain-containing protein [Pedobacter sp. HMF7647]|uniref:CHAP domain-containing protein n=1 Tax=Hufsiella arboris TaxID=2695275 RepID=A0A7K1Y6W1_9SPHI|nr:CHAP domain-containing protein [Hufsiella arboris]MXV50316.1 CHAP domain-containing protein [Hufsiella arboris]